MEYSFYNLNAYTVSNRDENNDINNDGVWFARKKISNDPVKYNILRKYEPLKFTDIKQVEKILSIKPLNQEPDWFNMRLHKGQLYKLYGDMDELSVDIDTSLEYVKNAYEKVLKIEISNISYTTNDDYKRAKDNLTSHHYVIPEYYATLEEQDSFKTLINAELKQYKIEIDESVYCERWFRLPNQKKGYMPNKGVENGIHRVIQGRLFDFVLDYINTDKSKRITYKIELPIQKPSNNVIKICPTINTAPLVSHEGEAVNVEMVRDYLNILDINKRSHWKPWADIMMMLRNYGLRELAHEFSKKMKNYNADQINNTFANTPTKRTLGIGSLKYWAMQDNPVECEELNKKYSVNLIYNDIYKDILLKEHFNKVVFTEETERISEEAIELIKKSKTTIVMSCTGSGKTTVVKQQIIDRNKKLSILSVSCIRTLAKSQEYDFGLTSYLNKNVGKRSIISYEQLPDYKGKYEIVILDEVTSLLKHIKSTTMRQRRESHLRLIELVKGAKIVIVCDAILTDVVYDFIKECRGDDIFFYMNTYKRWDGINIQIYEANNEMIMKKEKNILKHPKTIDLTIKTPEQIAKDNEMVYKDDSTEKERINLFLTELFESIFKGKTCAVLSDSKGCINCSHDLMLDYLVKHEVMTKEEAIEYVKLFTSDHGNLMNVRASYFKNHCLMFSPRIQFGVNIDTSVEYEDNSIYVIYKGKSIDPTAMLQQIGRFRGAKGNIKLLWLRRNYLKNENKFITLKEIEERETVKINSFINASKKLNNEMTILQELGCTYSPDNGYEFDDTCIFAKQHFKECWYDELFAKNKNQALDSLLKYYGYTTEYKMLPPIIRPSRSKSLKKALMIDDDEAIRELCRRYIDKELDYTCDEYALVSERVKRKLESIGMGRNTLRQLDTVESEIGEDNIKRKQIFYDIIIDENIYKYCVKGSTLFFSDEIIKRRNILFDIYNTIDMKSKNPATLALIMEIEKICNIKRFEYKKMVNESFQEIKKYLIDNTLFVSDALYGFSGISKAIRERRIIKKINNINNIKDVQELLIYLYNQYAPFFKNVMVSRKTVKNPQNGKINTIREYEIVRNEKTFEYVFEFAKRIDHCNRDIKHMKDFRCLFDDEIDESSPFKEIYESFNNIQTYNRKIDSMINDIDNKMNIIKNQLFEEVPVENQCDEYGDKINVINECLFDDEPNVITDEEQCDEYGDKLNIIDECLFDDEPVNQGLVLFGVKVSKTSNNNQSTNVVESFLLDLETNVLNELLIDKVLINSLCDMEDTC